jgi:hypothetical protein
MGAVRIQQVTPLINLMDSISKSAMAAVAIFAFAIRGVLAISPRLSEKTDHFKYMQHILS